MLITSRLSPLAGPERPTILRRRSPISQHNTPKPAHSRWTSNPPIGRGNQLRGRSLDRPQPERDQGLERAELLRRMWGRVEYCRRLAITTADPHKANALIQMAAEGEADIPRLMSEQDAPTIPAPTLQAQ